uniref:Uncharacterized protein n=3 Tax=Marmota marmota marmota TaxID=9994 RepID=A0A8C5ZS81_MARMA
MLRQVGLDIEYWLPKLQQGLGLTCPQVIEYLTEKDLQKLKSQVQHPWEKRALEKLVALSHSNSLPEFQESPVGMIIKKQKQVEHLLQELGNFLLEGRQRQEEAVRKKEAELRQAMEIPEEYWPVPEKPLREVMEIMQRQLSPKEKTLSHRQNLLDRDLIRWASGGLALQGVYQTCNQMDLIQKREELISVPSDFSLFGPQQGTRMETKQFTSFQEESMFTQTIEKMGFSVSASAYGGGWGIPVETGMNKIKHSESKETQQASSECTYFCSTKFCYVPLASCYFHMNELQLSKPALQELKYMDVVLDQRADTDNVSLLK